MQRTVPIFASVLAVFLCSASARAVHPKDDLSLSVMFPVGGDTYTNGGIGVWWMVTPRLNLGFNTNLSINFDSDQNDYVLGPAMRLYFEAFNKSAKIAPFLYTQLTLWFRSGYPDADEDTVIGAIIGFGAEWFYNKVISLAVYGGLEMVFTSRQSVDKALATTTSAITMQFYF